MPPRSHSHDRSVDTDPVSTLTNKQRTQNAFPSKLHMHNGQAWTLTFVASKWRHVRTALVLCPDSSLSWGKGSGDYWAISWSCWVSRIDFVQPNECHSIVCVNQWNTCRSYIMQTCKQRSFQINTADLALPRNCSTVTRTFSSWEGGVWLEPHRIHRRQEMITWCTSNCSQWTLK